ncbi:MAG: ABC transporter ATP-binding protein [Blastocatellia bacterium]|nr:ABC transporter ATP-binding protein [Blastocatellia bacterium]
MPPLLTISGISKRYGKRTVLQEVGFRLEAGEVLGLIGPNGAGKTTLLECLAGLLPGDAGSVNWEGKPLPTGRRKEVLFYLPDGITPWEAQTVEWGLGFFARLYRRPFTHIHNLVLSLKLDSLVRATIGSLSKGERKRFLLALGLLTPQPVLVLDEPFDGLDLRQTRDVMTLLRQEAQAGRTLLLSIHQLTDAARVCDRLVLLDAGRVAGEGTIDELRLRAGLHEGGLEEVFLALT